jgi:hypothetical protein
MGTKRLALMLALLIIVLTSTVVGAETVTWSASGSGNWSVSTNWSTNSAPAPGDDVVISDAGSGTITVNANAAIGTLTLGGAHKIALSTHRLTVNAASSFNKTVALGNSTGYSVTLFGDNEHRTMLLYRAAELRGSGWITAISFIYNEPQTAVTCPNVTIRMGHSSKTDLDTTFSNNVLEGKGSFPIVADLSSLAIPAGAAGDYYTIPLATPFYYNGKDNLVLEVARSACSGNVFTRFSKASVSYLAELYAGGNKAALTGSTGAYLADAKFTFTGGDESVNYVDAGQDYNTNSYPFNIAKKIQLLYTAAEINGSGKISGIGFPVGTAPRGNATIETTETVTLKLGHTNLSALTTVFADNFNVGSPLTAANAITYTIPAGVPDGSYVWIPLPDGTFNYNGLDNLVVEINVSSISGGALWIKDNGGTQTRLVGNTGATTGTTDGARHFMKFRFTGGAMDVLTAETAYMTLPFDNTIDNKQQFLYRAAELGTKGNITHVAFRLKNDSTTDSTYENFVLVLGHTTNTALGDTSFSGNMTGAQTVYSGPFTIPEGLMAGDWIEIPLSTPFAYDGASNLVVLTSNLSGSAVNAIFTQESTTRYPDRRAYYGGSNTTDDPANADDFLADLRLKLQ